MSPTLAEKTATIANLGSAVECESNVQARYIAFAAKAESDGWRGVASLFRAAARAEEIHSRNHSRALKQFGEEADCQIRPIRVRSTLQNLKVALAGEQHEIDSMYPSFLIEACAGNVNVAIRAFTWAIEAEKTHARLFREAIEVVEEGLKDTWAGSPIDFSICTVCGYTSELPEEDECCPVCNLPHEKFEVVR
jgi:rubrerythrin